MDEDRQHDARGETGPSDASQRDAGQRLLAHAGRLRLLVRHLTGRALQARIEIDDVVQEVFLRAWASPAGLPPRVADETDDHSLWPWLARIARHTVVDAARAARAAKRGGGRAAIGREQYTRSGESSPGIEQLAAKTAGPGTKVVGAETAALVEAAFGRLCAEHRRVIGLRQFEGHSAAATAVRMRRSEAAVHSLYRRALLAWEAELSPRSRA